jgi:hypothetical protein
MAMGSVRPSEAMVFAKRDDDRAPSALRDAVVSSIQDSTFDLVSNLVTTVDTSEAGL